MRNKTIASENTKRPAFRPISGSVLIALSLLGLALALYVVWELRSLIGTMVFASLVAYALSPVVGWLERAGVNRTLGIILVTTLMVATVALLLIFIVPALCREIAELAGQVPAYLQKAKLVASSLWERVFGEKFPSDAQSFIDTLTPQADTLKAMASKAAKPIGTIIAGTFKGIVAFILWLVGIAIMPVIVFYLLRDFDRITEGAVALIPKEKRNVVVGLFREINSTLGNLVRGQLLVALILSVLYCTGLWLIGVPYWPLLGFISGFASIIPYFSLVVGLIPSAIVAGFHSDPWWLNPLYVVLLFAGVQTLEGLVITPKIVGKKVGLHPLLIILALLIGGTLGGFVGIVLAVPCAAVLRVLFTHFYKRIRREADDEQDKQPKVEPAKQPEVQPEPAALEPAAESKEQDKDDLDREAPERGE